MKRQLTNDVVVFGRRLIGASRLDGATFREVAHDPGALIQAVIVILLSSLASVLVFLTQGRTPRLGFEVDWEKYPVTRESDLVAASIGGVLDLGWGLIIWGVQAAVVWFIWNRFVVETRSWRSIAAPLGFANAPLIVFALLELVPVVGGGLAIVGLLWTLVASVAALRYALETGWGRAVVLVLVSMVVLLPLSIAVSRLG